MGCWLLAPTLIRAGGSHWVRFPGEQVLEGCLLQPPGGPRTRGERLSPGLLERMVCRIMRDMVSLSSSVVLGRHQPSRSVHELSAPSLR